MKALKKWSPVALLVLSALSSQTGHAQARLTAEVNCRPTAETLQYDCEIRIQDPSTSRPLSGVNLSIGTEMPSMPGMHHRAPVKATEDPAGEIYRVRLELEMYGEWALQLNIAGHVRDRLVKRIRFEPDRIQDHKRSEMPAQNQRPSELDRSFEFQPSGVRSR
ncbi:FixH family protein [Bradyrhizobium sp. USDA 10063]